MLDRTGRLRVHCIACIIFSFIVLTYPISLDYITLRVTAFQPWVILPTIVFFSNSLQMQCKEPMLADFAVNELKS